MQLVNSIKRIVTATLLTLMFIAPAAMAQDCGMDNWDEDADGTLSAEEFETALVDVDYFSTWDTDADGTLTEEEWNTGADQYLADYDVVGYTEWDADGDDQLSDEEFNEGLFDLTDQNDDNLIDGDDWNTFDVEGDGVFC